jgi:hypothetical protein
LSICSASWMRPKTQQHSSGRVVDAKTVSSAAGLWHPVVSIGSSILASCRYPGQRTDSRIRAIRYPSTHTAYS